MNKILSFLLALALCATLLAPTHLAWQTKKELEELKLELALLKSRVSFIMDVMETTQSWVFKNRELYYQLRIESRPLILFSGDHAYPEIKMVNGD